jgi:hypothetical protein
MVRSAVAEFTGLLPASKSLLIVLSLSECNPHNAFLVFLRLIGRNRENSSQEASKKYEKRLSTRQNRINF